jgi:hypothetical protein
MYALKHLRNHLELEADGEGLRVGHHLRVDVTRQLAVGHVTTSDGRGEGELDADLDNVVLRQVPVAAGRSVGVHLEDTRDLLTRRIEEALGVRGDQVLEHRRHGRTARHGLEAGLDGRLERGVVQHTVRILQVEDLVTSRHRGLAVELVEHIRHHQVVGRVGARLTEAVIRRGVQGRGRVGQGLRVLVQVRETTRDGRIEQGHQARRVARGHGGLGVRRTSPREQGLDGSLGQRHLHTVTKATSINQVDLVVVQRNLHQRSICQLHSRRLTIRARDTSCRHFFYTLVGEKNLAAAVIFLERAEPTGAKWSRRALGRVL